MDEAADAWEIQTTAAGVSTFLRKSPEGLRDASPGDVVAALYDLGSPAYDAIAAAPEPVNLVPPAGSGIDLWAVSCYFLRERIRQNRPFYFRGEEVRLTGENGAQLRTAKYAPALSGMKFLRNAPFGIDGDGRVVSLRQERDHGQFVSPKDVELEDVPAAFEGECPPIPRYSGSIYLPEGAPEKEKGVLKELELLARENLEVGQRLASGGVFLGDGRELVFREGHLKVEAPMIPRPAREYAVAVSVDDLDLETGRPLKERSSEAETYLGWLDRPRNQDSSIHLKDWDATQARVLRAIRSYAEAARKNGALLHLGLFTHGSFSEFMLAPEGGICAEPDSEVSPRGNLWKDDIADLVGAGIPGVSVLVYTCHAEMYPWEYGDYGELPPNSIGFFASGLFETAVSGVLPELLGRQIGPLPLRRFIGLNGGDFETPTFEVPFSRKIDQWFLGDGKPTRYWVDDVEFRPVYARSEGFDKDLFLGKY